MLAQPEPITRTFKELYAAFSGMNAEMLMREMMCRVFPGRIALVTSFGAESAVLLEIASRIDGGIPVIFVDTVKHFEETLSYAETLKERFGLKDLRVVGPSSEQLERADPKGTLWQRDPDACCAVRKVAPLDEALKEFDAWISGRKKFQGDTRSNLQSIEQSDGQIKINPLADWSEKQIQTAFKTYQLPRHPLYAQGYLSIGCGPCTKCVAPGDSARSGRWAGIKKTECGIHRANQPVEAISTGAMS